MCDENIEIGVTEITNNILVSATPTDQKIDINVTEEIEEVAVNVTPSVVEVNIDVTQELITEIVTIDAETCVNIIDVSVTDASDNVTLNITPSIVEVNINRGGGGGGSSEWGSITGTLSDQTDLQSALDAKQDALGYTPVPSTRTITINGVTYDLSANRSWTVAGGLSGSGTTGYLTKWTGSSALGNSIAYEDAGNFLIGTTSSLYKLTVNTASGVNFGVGKTSLFGTNDAVFLNSVNDSYGSIPFTLNASHIGLYIGYSEKLRINASGNVLIGTTSDITGGGLLQVNGDVNISGAFKVNGVAIGSASGTVTSVAASVPTGFSVSGSPITTSGTLAITFSAGYSLPTSASQTNWDTAYSNRITSASSPLSISSNVISISQATTSTNGYLSSTDWNTFNGKQAALGYTPVPTTRTLTINGTAYDLSADRSWTISAGGGGTVTSVAASVPTGFSISGSPITSSGTLAITFSAGYSLPTTASQTNWDTAYTNRITSLTTSGSSGASTLISNVLNIPNYTLTGLGGVPTTRTLTINGTTYDLSADRSWTISGGSGITGSGTTNYITKWTGTSALGNSIIYDNGTSVGIGNTNPDFVSSGDRVLTISGSSTRSTLNLVNSSTGTSGVSGSIRGYNGTTPLALLDLVADGLSNSGAFVFYANNSGTVSEKLRISSQGNLFPSGRLIVQNGIDGGAVKGINMWTVGDTNWGIYMGQAGASKSFSGGTACAALDGTTSYSLRQRIYNGSANSFIWENSSEQAMMSLNGNDGRLWVKNSVRTPMIHINAATENRGHRIYSRTMDVNAYTTASSMRFTVAAGYSVQFQYELTFHASRTTSGNLAEIWYLKYTAGIAFDTAGNPNERWWSYREQDGNGIAGIGRNNQNGYFEVQNTAFDSGCRLTCTVAITCNNWDVVTVTYP